MLEVNSHYLNYLAKKSEHIFFKRQINISEVEMANNEPPSIDELKKFNLEFSNHKKRLVQTLLNFSQHHSIEIDHEFIKSVHRILNADKKSIYPGEYKKYPNAVQHSGGFINSDKAKPEDTHERMEKWIKLFNKSLTKSQALDQSIKEVSLLHIEFGRIHPFQDGNGTVSRLLTMFYFMSKDIAPPVIIKAIRKDYYIWIKNELVTSLSHYLKKSIEVEKEKHEQYMQME